MLPDKRARGSDGDVTETLRPFGVNPPSPPVTKQVLPPWGTTGFWPQGPMRPDSGEEPDALARLIHNDPRSLFYLAIPDKILPKTLSMIMRSGMGGDLWQTAAVCNVMLRTWPQFRKCSHELRASASSVKYMAYPYVEDEGDEPTDSAKEKAALVNRAMRSFKPNRFSDEKGMYGLVYDVTDAMLNGMSVVELLWQKVKSKRHGQEWLPQASAWVHQRHYTFSNDGFVVVFDDDYRRMYYGLAGPTGRSMPDPKKFLCAQFISYSGSALGAGFMAPLCWYWAAVAFGRDWMLGFAQKYGTPFLDLKYKSGTPPNEMEAAERFLREAQNNGYVMHVDTTAVEVHKSESLGTDNPNVRLLEIANKACQELLLGQSGTTQSEPGKLGNEDTHADVKREYAQSLARWVGTVLTEQFAASVLMWNYNSTDECPEVRPDYTEAKDPAEEADRYKVVVGMGLPVKAEQIYRDVGVAQPAEGETVFIAGKVGLMPATDEVLEMGAPQQGGGGGFGGQGGGSEGGEPGWQEGQEAGQEGVEDEGDEEPAEARGRYGVPAVRGAALSLRQALARAPYGQVAELREAIVRAEASGKANGEWDEVTRLVKKLRGGGGRIQLNDRRT
jgi:hypothetical protein